jgi:hypothetical protein
MAIANTSELLAKVQPLMGTSWELVSLEGRNQAAEQALSELGWSLPTTSEKQGYWSIERTRRHMLYILLVEQAMRFRYKQIHLQQRFDNHFKMIAKMDEAFAKEVENDVGGLFPAGFGDMSVFAEYGFFYNPAGFVYDQLGRDLTYDYS